MISVADQKLAIANQALSDILLNICGTSATEIADRAQKAMAALDAGADKQPIEELSTDPQNQLLKDVLGRTRRLDRDVAHHPATVRRVLGELDEQGPSDAGDCIHSLLWKVVLVENRAKRFAQELMRRRTFDTVSAEAGELHAHLDLRHKADLRAVAMWQHSTGKSMILPDHMDLCVWLLDELDRIATAVQANTRYTPAQRKTLEGAELLFNEFAQRGCEAFTPNRVPTPNRHLCLRFASEIHDLLTADKQIQNLTKFSLSLAL